MPTKLLQHLLMLQLVKSKAPVLQACSNKFYMDAQSQGHRARPHRHHAEIQRRCLYHGMQEIACSGAQKAVVQPCLRDCSLAVVDGIW